MRARTKRNRRRKRTRRRLRGGNSDAVVMVLFNSAGFFSVFFFLCRVYLYAKHNNLPFFLHHEDWQYLYKLGWHDYLTSLKYFEPDKYPNARKFRHADAQDIPEYSIREYIDCIKEIFVLKDELKARVEKYVASIGGEYTSLFIRRGDKAAEMELISIDDILVQTDIKDDGRRLFIQTDDYAIVLEIEKRFPSCKIFTLTPEHKRGAHNGQMINWTPEERRADTEELLVSVAVFVRAKKGWTYYLSNVGTFHKLSGYDNITFYIDSKNTRESVDRAYNLDNKGSPYSLVFT
jgi:hypothetical protein